MSKHYKVWMLLAAPTMSVFEKRVSGFKSVEDLVERGVEIMVVPHPVYKSGGSKWVGEYAILPTADGKALSRTTFPNAPMGPTREAARAAAKRDAEGAIRTMRVSIPGSEPNQRRMVDLVDLIGRTA